MKKVRENIRRNQNIPVVVSASAAWLVWRVQLQCKPVYCPITPPRMGESMGPRIEPSNANAMYVLLSDEVIRSPTMPLVSATVALLPALWRQRSTIRVA